MLNWYAPRPRVGGPPVIVVDPFAGGSTRGVVAAKLGFLYVGTDVGQGQVEANREQAEALCGDCTYQPKWAVCCGSRLGEALATVLTEHQLPTDTKADFLLTCPPYVSLEVSILPPLSPHSLHHSYALSPTLSGL